MKTIHTRKTIRKHTNKDVPEDLLKTLLEKTERTPTMENLQLYSVVITHNEGKKMQLAPTHFDQPVVMGTPVVLTFCTGFRRTTFWVENRKATPGYDDFLSFPNAATDALLYCQTFCNLAEEEGLGTCFLGTTIYNPKATIRILQLPRLVIPVATTTLGWPAESPPLTDHLPIDSIIHHETCEDHTPDRIDAFYTSKEQLEENKHFVEINNKETLAQVFTDLRYTKETNEALFKVLINSLKNQGFIKE